MRGRRWLGTVGGGVGLKVRSKGRFRGDLSPLILQSFLFLRSIDSVSKLSDALYSNKKMTSNTKLDYLS